MATSLHGWQLNPISLSPLACLVAWRVQAGFQRGPKGSKKGPQNDRKSTRNPPGHPLACPGVSGGTPTCLRNTRDAYLCVFMHIYAYIVHIYAYLCMYSLVLCIFMHTSCKRHPYLCIFMYIYAFSNMFMNVYVYLMHICTHLCSLYISVHTYTYLFTRRR